MGPFFYVPNSVEVGAEAADGAGNPTVLFGQRRVSENFSSLRSDGSGPPAYLAGRPTADVAADLVAGKLHPDQLPIQAFEYDGQLVSANTRSLSALSQAGMVTTKIEIIEPTNALLQRLTETPLQPDAERGQVALFVVTVG